MNPDQERFLRASLRRVERNTLDIEARMLELMEKIDMDNAQLATTLSGLASNLTGVASQLSKAQAEIVATIQAAGQTSPAVDAAVAQLSTITEALQTAAQALDDLNPDAPAAP